MFRCLCCVTVRLDLQHEFLIVIKIEGIDFNGRRRDGAVQNIEMAI